MLGGITLVLSGCFGWFAMADDGQIYTLYRNSPLDAMMRIHIATFDTSDGEAYNQENSGLAASLFQAQPGITTKFWCEKGRYHK